MKVLIVGASGLVGGNCLRFFRSKGMDCVGTYFSYPAKDTVFYDTLDPSNENNFDILGYAPDVVVHCGALTHVDYCEVNEEESYQKTVVSTANLVRICKKIGAKMVYISTDYVFDGKDGPYDETAKVNPVSVYGKHKLAGESWVLNELPERIVLRITNVYGDEERNKNFVSRIVEQILEGKVLQLRLPHDQYATPVNAADIARALYVLLNDYKSGIYNIASTDYVNRVQLADRILIHFPGASYHLEGVATAALNQTAARPLQGGLKMGKFLAEYPEFRFSNVDDFLVGKAIGAGGKLIE